MSKQKKIVVGIAVYGAHLTPAGYDVVARITPVLEEILGR